MIHLLYGDDSYRVQQALRSLVADLAAGDEMLESNTTRLDGAKLTPDELLAHATAVPFLADSRLVIVEGLLKQIGEQKRGRGRAPKKKAAADDPLDPWRKAAAVLGDAATMPATTTLVFVEPALGKTNAAFSIFAPVARSVEFKALDKNELPEWIRKTAAERELRITPRAIATLARLIGSDLWMLDNELDKLATYAGGDMVDEPEVAALVSSVQETKIWDLTDAVVAGNARAALTSLQGLLNEGQPPPLLASMLVRQYRQVVLVKDMRERRTPQGEMERAVGGSSYRLNALTSIASRYSWGQLRSAYAVLLDADLSVKRGLQDDESALQIAVHQLCDLARPGGASRTQPRASAAR